MCVLPHVSALAVLRESLDSGVLAHECMCGRRMVNAWMCMRVCVLQGLATGFFSDNDAPLARALIEVLQETSQAVPGVRGVRQSIIWS